MRLCLIAASRMVAMVMEAKEHVRLHVKCEAMFLIWIWLEKAKDNSSDEYAECTRYNYCSKVETGEGREVNRVQ